MAALAVLLPSVYFRMVSNRCSSALSSIASNSNRRGKEGYSSWVLGGLRPSSLSTQLCHRRAAFSRALTSNTKADSSAYIMLPQKLSSVYTQAHSTCFKTTVVRTKSLSPKIYNRRVIKTVSRSGLLNVTQDYKWNVQWPLCEQDQKEKGRWINQARFFFRYSTRQFETEGGLFLSPKPALQLVEAVAVPD